MITLAVIPARRGSKRIPRKNLSLLAGHPLIHYTLSAAIKSKLIDRTIVSTDDPDIAAIASDYGIEVRVRPQHLSGDTSPTIDTVKDVVQELSKQHFIPDSIILLQPTSPLRTHHHIDQAIQDFSDASTDSLVSVIKVPHSYRPQSLMMLGKGHLKHYTPELGQFDNGNEANTLYARNGAAIYIFSYSCLTQKNSLYGDSIAPFVMEPNESIDINVPWDLELCEWILGNIAPS